MKPFHLPRISGILSAILCSCFLLNHAEKTYAGFLDNFAKMEIRSGKILFLPQRENMGGVTETSNEVLNFSRVSRRVVVTQGESGRLEFLVTESGDQEMGKYTCKSGRNLDFLSGSRKSGQYLRYQQSEGEKVCFETGELTPAVLEMLKDQDTSQKKGNAAAGLPDKAPGILAIPHRVLSPLLVSPETEKKPKAKKINESPQNAAPKARIYQANSLWEMVLLLPEEDFILLQKFFSSVYQGTNLTAYRQKIIEALVQTAESGESIAPEDCRQLIAQLADPNYSRREAADRQLSKMGGYLLVAILKIDWNSLDTEQQFRLHRLRERLENESKEDDVRIYSRVLMLNPWMWLAILESPQKKQRECALNQLRELLQEKIEYDTDADPEKMKSSRDALREKLGRGVNR